MSSKELLAHLQNGAKLRTRWRYGKCTNELTLANGTKINIQRSTIKGLYKGLEAGNILHAIDFGGGNFDYYLEMEKSHDVQSAV